MDPLDPEKLLNDYQYNRIGFRAVITEILRHLIVLTRLLEVVLHRHNELSRDMAHFATTFGLSRPSQAQQPWYQPGKRQTDLEARDQAAPGDEGGSGPSSNLDEG
jgi:hypothetical protein